MKKDISNPQKKEYPGLIAIKIEFSESSFLSSSSLCYALMNYSLDTPCTDRKYGEEGFGGIWYGMNEPN